MPKPIPPANEVVLLAEVEGEEEGNELVAKERLEEGEEGTAAGMAGWFVGRVTHFLLSFSAHSLGLNTSTLASYFVSRDGI